MNDLKRYTINITDIVQSIEKGFIPPDIAICDECIKEIQDKMNRRYMYPFTNCTSCGPRYSIIKTLPYDRVNTSMSAFEMCPECRSEYESPENRRFHVNIEKACMTGVDRSFFNSIVENLTIISYNDSRTMPVHKIGKNWANIYFGK